MSQQSQLHIGQIPKRAVLELIGVFDFVKRSSLPRLVVISGVQGIGKTRVIQEFFAALASKQRGRPYWPSTLLPNTQVSNPLSHRNIVNPPMIESAKPRRQYAWYAQTCRRAEGTSDIELRSAQLAFEQLQKLHPVQGVHRVLIALYLACMAVGLVVEAANGQLSVPTPLLWIARITTVIGFVMSVRDLATSAKALRERRVNATKFDASASQIDYLNQSFRFIKRESVRRQRPVIVVIDNWHMADSATQDFVAELLDLDGPVFVILARWKTGFTEQGNSAIQNIENVGIVIELGPLTLQETAELIELNKPEIPTLVRNELADHSEGIPLVAITQAQSASVRILCEQGLGSDEIRERIRRLPRDHEGTLKAQWHELPREIQEFLAVASIFGEIIPTELVKKTFARYFSSNCDEIHQQVRDPYWWLAILQSDIDHFPEGFLYRIAREQAAETLPSWILKEIETSVAQLQDEDLPEPLRAHGVFGHLVAAENWERRLLLGHATRSLRQSELAFQRILGMDGSQFVITRQRIAEEEIRWLQSFLATTREEESMKTSLLNQFKYYYLKTVARYDLQQAIRLARELCATIGSHPLRCDASLRLANLLLEAAHQEPEALAEAEKIYQSLTTDDACQHVRDAARLNLVTCCARSGDYLGAIRTANRMFLKVLLKVLTISIKPRQKRKSTKVDQLSSMFTMNLNIAWWRAKRGQFRFTYVRHFVCKIILRFSQPTVGYFDNVALLQRSHIEVLFADRRFERALEKIAEYETSFIREGSFSESDPDHRSSHRIAVLKVACLACTGDAQSASELLRGFGSTFAKQNSLDKVSMGQFSSLLNLVDDPIQLHSSLTSFPHER